MRVLVYLHTLEAILKVYELVAFTVGGHGTDLTEHWGEGEEGWGWVGKDGGEKRE
jgi:hypothetical protein